MSEDEKAKEQQKSPNMGFGITKETVSSNAVKMLPPVKGEVTKQFPSGYHFPIAKLVNVVAKDEYETKNGKTQVLQFIFKDKEGRQHIRTEWAQDPDDEKYLTKMDAINYRIKQLYDTYYSKLPEGGLGVGASNFFDYFSKIAEAFKVNPDIHKIPVYLKLVFFNGNFDFPYKGNFIEKVVDNKPCKLEINLKYDKIVQTAPTNTNIPGVGAGGAEGEDIDFESEYN